MRLANATTAKAILSQFKFFSENTLNGDNNGSKNDNVLKVFKSAKFPVNFRCHKTLHPRDSRKIH